MHHATKVEPTLMSYCVNESIPEGLRLRSLLVQIIDDEPESEICINPKKNKGDAVVPDAKEKKILLETAVCLINELIAGSSSLVTPSPTSA